MSRVYSLGSWLLGSMAVALLAISFILVPTGRALADNGGAAGPSSCSGGDAQCNNDCVGNKPSGFGICYHTCKNTPINICGECE